MRWHDYCTVHTIAHSTAQYSTGHHSTVHSWIRLHGQQSWQISICSRHVKEVVLCLTVFLYLAFTRILSWLYLYGNIYNGILPCFLHGFSTFFVFKNSRSSHILWRVFGGSKISSMKPLWAAMNGLANLHNHHHHHHHHHHHNIMWRAISMSRSWNKVDFCSRHEHKGGSKWEQEFNWENIYLWE